MILLFQPAGKVGMAAHPDYIPMIACAQPPACQLKAQHPRARVSELKPLERLGVLVPRFLAHLAGPVADPLGQLFHLQAHLAGVARQRRDARLDASGDVLPIVGVISPKQIRLSDAPRLHLAHQLFGKNVPLTGGIDRVQRRLSGGAVVGMELVAPPRIDRHAGCGACAGGSGWIAGDAVRGVLQQAIGVAQKDHLLDPQLSRGSPLFLLPQRGQPARAAGRGRGCPCRRWSARRR